MHQDTICDLYLRLSLDRDGKTAIERQEADCRAWAERNALSVRKVHIDRGRSGYKSVERKGFDAALAAITAGVVGTLVVWKLDRLSRKGIGQVGQVLDDIEKAGGRLVSVIDGLDTSNDSPAWLLPCSLNWRGRNPRTWARASVMPSAICAARASGSAGSRLTGSWWTRRPRS
ncbi:recombinase family protein [Streptomyces griseoluteus]|uniref:recombinase family protein n=1 Tax=Streptomyces griseoluteus TaxID=29306 RepID=UPI0038259A0E